jgi:hypothetical protein
MNTRAAILPVRLVTRHFLFFTSFVSFTFFISLIVNRSPQQAGGKRFQGSQPPGEFDGGQAALAVEGAQKVFCCGFAFLGVALDAGRDEIAVGIAAHAGKGHDMIEAADAGGEPAQTIEAEAAVARMNDVAPRADLKEIHLLDVGGAAPTDRARGYNSIRRGGANLAGQADLNHVTGSGAFDKAQNALGNEAAYGLAHGRGGEASAAGEPTNRKAEPELAFEAAMPQEMSVDDALGEGETQPRHENIFDLFPDEDDVEFVVFHDLSPVREVWVRRCGEMRFTECRLGVRRPDCRRQACRRFSVVGNFPRWLKSLRSGESGSPQEKREQAPALQVRPGGKKNGRSLPLLPIWIEQRP